ncbi:hypothetical protein GCM10022243_52960 [Saccharothrix violaceirubra]|uniref:GNAT superfamily N-acetyltransferase n=1 Tax=Saccharothrix violaceirubra TaxID=413306 RepID=A0A7W7SYM1_9PSEU|nr:hypothetical protein [Saccharothrix violaceirubra]MBB4963358.1 GNAT superfamily N-acetyltransferase [Saccharothrix violaceirubra]
MTDGLVRAAAHLTERWRAHPDERPALRAPLARLAGRFRAEADACRERGDLRVAVAQRRRELALRRRLDDPHETTGTLLALVDDYRGLGARRQVLDCADEVLAIARVHRDEPAIVEAHRRLHALLAEFGRPEAVRHDP